MLSKRQIMGPLGYDQSTSGLVVIHALAHTLYDYMLLVWRSQRVPKKSSEEYNNSCKKRLITQKVLKFYRSKMSLICLCSQKGRQRALLVVVDSLYLEFKRDQRISSRWRKFEMEKRLQKIEIYVFWNFEYWKGLITANYNVRKDKAYYSNVRKSSLSQTITSTSLNSFKRNCSVLLL